MIEGNDAVNGFEGGDVRRLVQNYQQMRSECLSFRHVYKLLGKQQLLADNTKLLDATQIPQIARDLEERNKQLTLQQLKKQGQSYQQFNAHVLRVIEDTSTNEDSGGDNVRSQFECIESGEHFENKYNMD